MTVAALIVAAGRGSRAAGEDGRPKQYCPIGGVPIVARAIAAFAEHPRVDDIVVVIHADDERLYHVASEPFAQRLRKPVQGGARRQDSLTARTRARPRQVSTPASRADGPEATMTAVCPRQSGHHAGVAHQ